MDQANANFKDDTFSCAVAASRNEKFEFLKAYLNCLTPGELGKVKGICGRAKRRKLREGEHDIEEENVNGQKRNRIEDVVQDDTGDIAEQKEVVVDSVTIEAVVPISTATTPAPFLSDAEIKPWYQYWNKKKVTSLDVGFVELESEKGMNRHKAGKVSIVDYQQKALEGFPMYVKRTPGSFVTNSFLIKLNGIQRHTLQNGTPVDEVQEKVKESLEGKLCVGSGIEKDFRSLEIPIGDFEKVGIKDNISSGVFDLQWHWRKHQRNKFGEIVFDRFGEPVTQGIGLRSLYHYYFNEDIQAGIHDPTIDAKAAVRLFLEVYVNINKTNIQSMHCEYGQVYDEIPTLK